ncbi:MAG TPA: glycine oxidase ThiO [Vicinamibacterales bacterium]|nr:glycine oxidase ThiO [Vicinamibacterales bacterium]
MNILVVGAGIIGASIAEALARRGADVTVLDMRAYGRGASWASAGLLAPYTEAHGETPLLRMGVRSLEMYDDWIRGVGERSGRAVEIEYARTGTLEVALDDGDVTRLGAVKSWLDAARVHGEWMDGTAARAFEPALAPAAIGGLFISVHGFVGVGSLVTALVNSARFSGVVFESAVEAIDITSSKTGVVVRAGERKYAADRAVVAAGSWSKRVRVANVAALPVRPVRGQLLHLGWQKGARPLRPVWGSACYTVPWSNGTLLVGATVEEVGFDESTTAGGVASLLSAVTSMLPAASGATLLEARAGLRPATADGLPFIGTLEAAPNVFVATGHYRNGILLAPLTAALAEAALLGGRGEVDTDNEMLAMTSPDRILVGGGR